jgi:GxxExxY protein
LLVERKVVVELKVVEKITPVHEAQMLSYLRFSGCKIGLLLNFDVKLLYPLNNMGFERRETRFFRKTWFLSPNY